MLIYEGFVKNNAMHTAQSVYIHWPFVRINVLFVRLLLFQVGTDLCFEYHQALQSEFKEYKIRLKEKQKKKRCILVEVHLVLGQWICYLTFGTLEKYVRRQTISEITLEVNPGTVTVGKVAAWKQVGITRLNIGVQSLNDGVLRLGRHQKSR